MALTLKLSTGLRNAMVGKEAEVIACKVGANMALVDGGASEDTITNSDSDFLSLGFAPDRPLYLLNCTTAANDAAVTGVKPTEVVAGTITLPTGTVNTAETLAAAAVLAQAKGGSLYDMLLHGVIDIYSGTQPDSPDDVPNGTKLLRITLNGGAFSHGSHTNGLVFGDEASGVLSEETGADWAGDAIASGTAAWFRWKGNPADADGASTTLARMDGSIGNVTGSYDLVMPTTTLVSGQTYRIQSADLTMPASA